MRMKIFVIAFFCLLTSCADYRTPPSESSDSLSTDMHISVEPTDTPEKYIVYFSWPQLKDDLKLRIRQAQTLAVVDNNITTFSQTVDHNQILTYNFDVIADSGGPLLKSFAKQVQIPRDYVVRADQSAFSADENVVVERMFLNSETPLVTNGFNVKITTDLLVADGGVIETFLDKDLNAAVGADGKSGGNLTIVAKSASGTLSIKMYGQNGGNGIDSPDYPNRAADGNAPTCGYNDCINAGHGPPRCFCQRGANGTNGANGLMGLIGGAGGSGGDSGTVSIKIDDGSALTLTTDIKPGTAGLGGLGGNGQPGGEAPSLSGCPCYGSPGLPGKPGIHGIDGPPGLPGKQDTSCIYIKSESKNDCF